MMVYDDMLIGIDMVMHSCFDLPLEFKEGGGIPRRVTTRPAELERGELEFIDWFIGVDDSIV